MNDIQILDDLQAAIDELWRQKCEVYKNQPDEYTRGEMNVVCRIKRAISEVKKKNEPPKDLWEWLELLEGADAGLH